MRLFLLNKPFQVMCQFTDDSGRKTLSDYVVAPGVYPAGRLDYDSEGLVLLTDDGKLKARISHPESGVSKRYLAQVDGTITPEAVQQLVKGVVLKDGPARAVSARVMDEPDWLPVRGGGAETGYRRGDEPGCQNESGQHAQLTAVAY